MRNTLKAMLVIATVFPALSYAIMAGSMGDAPPPHAVRRLAAAAIAPAARTALPPQRTPSYAGHPAALQTCTSCHEVLGIHNPAVELCNTCHSK